jgi:hypothetical protein
VEFILSAKAAPAFVPGFGVHLSPLTIKARASAEIVSEQARPDGCVRCHRCLCWSGDLPRPLAPLRQTPATMEGSAKRPKIFWSNADSLLMNASIAPSPHGRFDRKRSEHYHECSSESSKKNLKNFSVSTQSENFRF